jgi:hypothetical protein
MVTFIAVLWSSTRRSNYVTSLNPTLFWELSCGPLEHINPKWVKRYSNSIRVLTTIIHKRKTGRQESEGPWGPDLLNLASGMASVYIPHEGGTSFYFPFSYRRI